MISVTLVLEGKKRPAEGYPTRLNTIGDHLRKVRMDRGLLQKNVANIIGVDVTTIGNWELNRSEPFARYLPSIIDFLEYVPSSVERIYSGWNNRD